MKIIGIYKILNPLGKVYVGQSTDILSRFNRYKNFLCKEQPKLYNSLRKYHPSTHEFIIIQECMLNELNDLERYYISLFKSTNENGMNLTHGGQDYFKHTEETRKKMSLAQMGNTKTRGRKQTIEEIEKRTNKRRGKKMTIDQRKRMSESQKGKILSEETKKKMSISKKGKGSKKVIDISTNTIYETVSDAAKAFHIKKTTLIAKLNGQNKNNTNLKYKI